MQIKTTIRYYFTSIGMAIIKKILKDDEEEGGRRGEGEGKREKEQEREGKGRIGKDKYWRECGENETLVHCWEEHKMLWLLWKIDKCTLTMQSNNPLLGIC